MTLTVTRDGTTEMSQSYAYDKLNRLTSVSENGQVIAAYTYDLNNRLTGISKVSGGVTTTEQYTYDNNGNQTSKTVSGASGNVGEFSK